MIAKRSKFEGENLLKHYKFCSVSTFSLNLEKYDPFVSSQFLGNYLFGLYQTKTSKILRSTGLCLEKIEDPTRLNNDETGSITSLTIANYESFSSLTSGDLETSCKIYTLF